MMAMAADDIAELIRAAIPDARVEITDLAGDGVATLRSPPYRVVSESFRGQSRVDQQRRVMAAKGGLLHALQLTTAIP